jgi:hypothetical protein
MSNKNASDAGIVVAAATRRENRRSQQKLGGEAG